jgi:hypothetical protein
MASFEGDSKFLGGTLLEDKFIGCSMLPVREPLLKYGREEMDSWIARDEADMEEFRRGA